MARPRAKLDRLGQRELVIERLKTEPAGINRERLNAVRLGMEGELGLGEIARQTGRSRATIQTWFDLYRQHGIGRLCGHSAAKAGRKCALGARAEKELRKKLAKGSFRRVDDARGWLKSRFGLDKPQSTVRRWLGKLGAGLKVVRPRHPKSDPGARSAFRSQLARRILAAVKAKVTDHRNRPLRLWVADEARFGLKPSHRRAWVTRGVRAHKSSLCRYEWQYVWAALQVGGGGSEFFYSNKADQAVSAVFLRQISQRDPRAVHVVIWDGAGFHPDNDGPGVPDNVVLVRQPPYSPELNPVEKLWDMLRDGLCNRTWRGLDDLMNAATRWLSAFWNEPRRILSLIGDGWMLRQANAC
jgi:transposase